MTRFALSADAMFGVAGADTVVVENGRIADVTQRAAAGIPIRDFPGATILPSFTDSHIHPLGYAALLDGVSLMESRDMGDLQERLAAAADRLPAGRALMAQRWDDAALGRLPDRHDIDTAVADRPVIAYRYCGHVAVANSAALDLASVGPTTPDPPGGSLDRDPAGAPTGVLREKAIELVAGPLENRFAAPSPQALLTALEGLVGAGILHIGAMASTGEPIWCGVGDEVATLCELAGDAPLTMDVMVIAETPPELENAASRLEAAGGNVRFWGWKGFADGSLGGHTAAMYEPYRDQPTIGTVRLPENVDEMARTALKLGGTVSIHAIGDRAIDLTLDLFQRLIYDGADPHSLRVEHASVPTIAGIERMAELGVVGSVQPSFLLSEAGWIGARLGSDRVAYPLVSLREAGVELIGGSDCPVERPDPLAGMAAAVRRPGWTDSEHLSVAQAVDLYTASPSRHFGLPEPLAKGSPADLVLVDGEVGTPEAVIRAVYRQGVELELAPMAWPG